jgi:acyl dehydratase
MAINRDYLGRVYESPQPYEVTRVKIREFADAIGDPNPVYTDAATARAAGYEDVIAPPTFPIIMAMDGAGQAIVDPDLRLDFSMVVHGDQAFRYTRPLCAGDVVTTTTTIADIKALGGDERFTLESEIRTTGGELVVTSMIMLVVRGGAAKDRDTQGSAA